jgi:hypothetical protein
MGTLLYFGLAVIAVAWLDQLYKVFKGNKEIQKLFIALYLIGVALLVVDAGLTDTALYQLMTMVASALVLIKMSLVKKKKR